MSELWDFCCLHCCSAQPWPKIIQFSKYHSPHALCPHTSFSWFYWRKPFSPSELNSIQLLYSSSMADSACSNCLLHAWLWCLKCTFLISCTHGFLVLQVIPGLAKLIDILQQIIRNFGSEWFRLFTVFPSKKRHLKKFQIPLRTPQRPQPVFDPNRVCSHFKFCCHKCTYFAWPIHEACGSHTLHGSVVQLYSHNCIQLCSPVRHFVVTSAHTLLGPVCCTTWHYPLHTLVVHTLCFEQLYCCTFIV